MGIEDKAQEHEILVWQQVNCQERGKFRYEPGDPEYGPEFCDCGEEIPLARRAYGFQTCIECASLSDRSAARLRR